VHVPVFIGRIVVRHVADIGPEENVTAAGDEPTELANGDADESLHGCRINVSARQLERPELERRDERDTGPAHSPEQGRIPGSAFGCGMGQYIHPTAERGREARLIGRVRHHQLMPPVGLAGCSAYDRLRHRHDARGRRERAGEQLDGVGAVLDPVTHQRPRLRR
jgi:hypothetical protein